MKRATFITLFIVTQIVCVILHIAKHNRITQLSYTTQKYERERSSLVHKKEQLIKQLSQLTSAQSVVRTAEKQLRMQPVSLRQIKRARRNEQLT